MSKSTIRAPPFTEEEDVVAIPPPSQKAVTLTNILAGDEPSRDPKASKKRTLIAGPSAEDRNKKPKNQREIAMPPPPASANVVAQTYAKLGHQTVSEVDLNNWSQSDFEENNSMLTKALGEAFFRQASRQKEIRALFSTKSKLEKEIDGYKLKLEAVAVEKKQAVETHKKHVERATESLKNDLEAERKKTSELESARIADQEKIATLEGKIATLEANQSQAISDATALGKVQFMKSFMRKLPDFDWNQLGAATGQYAEDLRIEMIMEAKQKADEAEARRVAEEAKDGEAPDDTPAS